MGHPPRKIVPLTDEQRRFAEDHHNLIYSFLRKNRLSIEDYYDIAAIGFLYAIQDFDPNRGCQFSTIAYLYMLSATSNARRKIARRSRIQGVSLESSKFEDGLPLLERLPATELSVENKVISQISAQNLLLQMDAKEQRTVIQRALGLTTKEISGEDGQSKFSVSARMYKLKKRLTPLRETL